MFKFLSKFTQLIKPEIVLETFIGTVEDIDGDVAFIRIQSNEHGDELAGKYSAEVLKQKGIFVGDSFSIKTIKRGNWTRVQIERK